MNSLFNTFMDAATDSTKATIVISDNKVRCSVNLNLLSIELDNGNLFLGDDDQQVIIEDIGECDIEERGDDFVFLNKRDYFLAIISLF